MTYVSVISKEMPADFSNDPARISDEELGPIFSNLIGRPVEHLERVRGGRNSSVFKISCRDKEFIGKVYPPANNGRDRLASEFSAFTFLRQHGVDSVPEPLAAAPEKRIGVYEHIPGERPHSASVTEADIDSATEFLGTLSSLAADAGAENLPVAAEACFSTQSIVDNIQSRLVPLEDIGDTDQNLNAFGEYLSDSFVPALHEITEWSRSVCELNGLEFDSEIDQQEMNLSPSDFGFHNSVRRPNGEIAFLDFEYFGWDDPAKTISDFLLHPAMELADPLKKRFMSGAVHHLDTTGRLAQRVNAVYPLFGLKWSLILLNEFLPEHLARRWFADGGSLNRGQVLTAQLEKSKAMTNKMINEYQRFQYHD